ncbi:hypothetical protein SUGI_0531570, partial [Cryptomeria japonica]
ADPLEQNQTLLHKRAASCEAFTVFIINGGITRRNGGVLFNLQNPAIFSHLASRGSNQAVGRSSHKMIEAAMQSTTKGKIQTIRQAYFPSILQILGVTGREDSLFSMAMEYCIITANKTGASKCFSEKKYTFQAENAMDCMD